MEGGGGIHIVGTRKGSGYGFNRFLFFFLIWFLVEGVVVVMVESWIPGWMGG